jgi:hypothetical protein
MKWVKRLLCDQWTKNEVGAQFYKKNWAPSSISLTELGALTND